MNEGFSKLRAELAADVETYGNEVHRFLSGLMPADTLKAKRVPRGVYEQRCNGTFMVRVRVTAGILNREQAGRLSELSRTYGDGVLHITTRQAVQIHGVLIKDTPEIMRSLLEVGLTTKGGGGNTVRNVTTCPYAGVCPQECVDVTGCANAVTDYLIGLSGSYSLPRKYKISFSGCRADCGLAQISDLGFVGEIREGRPGFRVFAGGGLGAHSRVAGLLLEWIPAQEVIRIAEAIRRVFDQHGDRKNKHRARLRFVVERVGESAFHRLFHEELDRVVAAEVPTYEAALPVVSNRQTRVFDRPVLSRYRDIYYFRQRQEGMVTIPLRHQSGLVTGEEFARLGELVERFSADGRLYSTRAQELQIRFVETANLDSLIAELDDSTVGANRRAAAQRFTSCAGADTCRLGLCLSRNAVLACEQELERAGYAENDLRGFAVHVNGCPNACGHQPVASIGFSGAAQKVDGHLAPCYRITLGGRCGPEDARLGTSAGKVPAKTLPAFLSELAADFAQHAEKDETFSRYFDRKGPDHFREMTKRHSFVPRFEDSPDYYRDFGSEKPFSLAGRGAGDDGIQLDEKAG